MHTLQHYHDDFINKSLVAYMSDLMAHEFDELALNDHSYPTWTPPAERDAAFLDTYKYQSLYII
jgi:hypothetical protein